MAMIVNAEELGVDREVMLREVAFYLQAGSHSTSDAFTHAADEILRWARRNPELADRLAGRPASCSAACTRCSGCTRPARSPSGARWPTSPCGTVASCRRARVVVMDIQAANRDVEVYGPDAGEFNPLRTVPAGVPRGVTRSGAACTRASAWNSTGAPCPRTTARPAPTTCSAPCR